MKVKTSSQADPNAVRQGCSRSQRAFTLAEVIIAMAITALSLSGVVVGYILAA
jgi:prepilin-type N-terminal cleavage/methylation domain-containing protein